MKSSALTTPPLLASVCLKTLCTWDSSLLLSTLQASMAISAAKSRSTGLLSSLPTTVSRRSVKLATSGAMLPRNISRRIRDSTTTGISEEPSVASVSRTPALACILQKHPHLVIVYCYPYPPELMIEMVHWGGFLITRDPWVYLWLQ